jgi:hypothetical protein
MWTYANRVLIPHQIHYSAEHGIPRGNFSDLYPRWYGSRELLLHGRDPYSAEITHEIQQRFYGRPLDPDGPGNRNYQQGFYYPVYVAFGLAPTIHLPFEKVRQGFFWLMFVLTVATVPLWTRILRWPVSLPIQVSLILFTLGSLPAMQGLKLDQITLLVMPLLAIALFLLAKNRQISAGILLAMTTIKPQLVFLLLLWLAIWTLADCRRRYRLMASFLLSMVILSAASEWYLPHWIPLFLRALYEYRHYTGEISVLDTLIGVPWSRLIEVAAFALTLWAGWRARRERVDSDAFASTLSLVLSSTVLLVPTYGPYNQVLLLPAVVVLLKGRGGLWRGNLGRGHLGRRSIVNRALCCITVALIVWPWISSVALALLSFVLPPLQVEAHWTLPFWTTLQIPLAAVALMFVYFYQTTFTAPIRAGSS